MAEPFTSSGYESSHDALSCGFCSCSTTSSRTCSRPTSNSSMLRRSILPLLTASARIARAPIATAPIAVAPTARAPRPMAPIAARPSATWSPEQDCSVRVALHIFISLAPHPSSLASCVPPTPGPKAPRHQSRTQPGCVHPEAYAPAHQRPVEPPHPARKHVYGEQGNVDHREGERVDVEAFDDLHPGVCPFVALLFCVHA